MKSYSYSLWLLGSSLEWLALVFSTLLRQGDVLNLFFCLLFFFYFEGFSFREDGRSRFLDLYKQKLLVQKTPPPSPIARLQRYNKKNLGIFSVLVCFPDSGDRRTAHTRRTFWRFYHLGEKINKQRTRWTLTTKEECYSDSFSIYKKIIFLHYLDMNDNFCGVKKNLDVLCVF